MSKTLKVFVYGTLKVGGHFAGRFDDKRNTIKQGTINGTMFSIGGSFPGVVLNGNTVITGEVHEYSDPARVESALDMIEGYYAEGHDGNLYNKKTVTVKTSDGEEECMMYEFARSTDDVKEVTSGIWES